MSLWSIIKVNTPRLVDLRLKLLRADAAVQAVLASTKGGAAARRPTVSLKAVRTVLVPGPLINNFLWLPPFAP